MARRRRSVLHDTWMVAAAAVVVSASILFRAAIGDAGGARSDGAPSRDSSTRPGAHESPASTATVEVPIASAGPPRISSPPSRAPSSAAACSTGRALAVHFYDVGQALAALVDLPDGRHVLVDTGDSPRRRGCDGCADRSARLLDRLRADLRSAPIDLVWITHQHSDHIGGAPAVLEAFDVRTYVDNGRGERRPEVAVAHRAAEDRGVPIHVVDPKHTGVPLSGGDGFALTAVIPPAWPSACRDDENECSIGLRIDFCASSVLFAGDAEHDEEGRLDTHGPATLLQVGHHGSDTSSSPSFLWRVRPRYAVISAGAPGEGMNREYCHPRAIVVRRLTTMLGGAGLGSLESFDGVRCDRATQADWVRVPTSDRLWAVERDGDVTLVTAGDGVFERRADRGQVQLTAQ